MRGIKSKTGFPTVIATCVVRGAAKGQSHGGLFRVDLKDGSREQILDWAELDIEWEGSGRDRGLRGITFYKDRVIVASSSEILLFDKQFAPIGRFSCPYMFMCHEIDIYEDELFISSTGYDSILVYDFIQNRFVRGYHLFFENWFPALRLFDPEGPDGPKRKNEFHINNVFVVDGEIFFSGLHFNFLMGIGINGKLWNVRAIAKGTHNVRRYRDGLLMNDTPNDSILYVGFETNMRFPIVRYDPEQLIIPPGDYIARQQFGRGLTVFGDLIIGGSAPSTISIYRFGTPEPEKAVNLTMDIRHSIHGLEIWPFS